MTVNNTPSTIQPYIDAGWWTVPISSVTRNDQGIKQFIFPKGHSYMHDFNEIASQAGTAFCGAKSGITILDFDNDELFHIAKLLAPNCKYIARSDYEGKGGHLGFLYEKDLPSRRLRKRLDILNDGSQVFLVSQGNTTKIAETWSTDLEPMPKELKSFVLTLMETQDNIVQTKLPTQGSLNVGYKLAPMLETLEDGKFNPVLFRIITPKDFRNSTYIQQGFLHPNDISIEGRGSEYLSKIAAILASDITVSPELFKKTLNYINRLWDDPMPNRTLDTTIINRMLEGTATNDSGEPFWKYNAHWDYEGITGVTKSGNTFEVFYEPDDAVFVYINLTSRDYQIFNDKSKALTHIQMLTGKKISNDNFMQLIRNIKKVIEPKEAYGYYNNGQDSYFNTFNQSIYLQVLHNPEVFDGEYQTPETILKFLETLIPVESKRLFFLQWLKRKLLTFDYSPLIWLFVGAPGSGKNTLFEDIITKFIGSDYVGSPSVEEFCDKFNGWIMGKYFFLLDEFGELARSKKDHEAIKANLKRFTGSGANGQISLRLMHKDSYQYNMQGSFFMAANKFPLILEPEDRRLVIVDTPNKLVDQEWVKKLGGTHILKDNISNELVHFAVYLATEIEDIDRASYTTSIEDRARIQYLTKTSPFHVVIGYLLSKKYFQELYDFFYSRLDKPQNMETWFKGYILVDKLKEDYEGISGKDYRILEEEMKTKGFTKTMVTYNGKTQQAYEIHGIKTFEMPIREVELTITQPQINLD